LGAIRFLAERERPIHLSKFPVLAAMPKRFCNDCETSELFRLGSIILYLRLHSMYFGCPLQRLTCRCKPLFHAASRHWAPPGCVGTSCGHLGPINYGRCPFRPAPRSAF